jgi:hypothetical protein
MIWAGITTIVVFYIVTIIINIRFCLPTSMTAPVPDPEEWRKKLEASTCSQPVYNLNAAVGLFGVMSDIYVLIIPVSMVFRLRLPRNRKLGIQAIFLTGLLYARRIQNTETQTNIAQGRCSLVNKRHISLCSAAFVRFHLGFHSKLHFTVRSSSPAFSYNRLITSPLVLLSST